MGVRRELLTIIGAGPAGLAAALYGGRAGLEPLLVEKLSPGGQVLVTDWVENYPGFPDGISGYELMEKFAAHARRFGMKELNGEVESIFPGEEGIELKLVDGESILSRAVIVATGAGPNLLGVPGEKEFTGKGVSYCATCDGPFFRGKVVAVVGGGDSAVQEAAFLTKFAEKVYLIHRRDRLRAIKILQDKALSNPKIEPIWNTVVERIQGSQFVEGVSLYNRREDRRWDLPVDGVFIFVGIHPHTDFLADVVELDEQGFIVTDQWMRTGRPGIYAAGDCRSKPLRQIVTAAAEGATAAYAVEHDLSME